MRGTKLLAVFLILSTLPCKFPEFANSAASAASDIILSEVYPDPKSGEKEYIELYNASAEEIKLDELRLYDVSSPAPGSCTNEGLLQNLSGSIAPRAYLAIELSSARLNNNGDRVMLKNGTGQILDEINYGVCGEVNAEDGLMVGRKDPQDQVFQKLSPTPSGENYLLELDPIKAAGKFETNEIVSFETSADLPEQNIDTLVWTIDGESLGKDVWSVDYVIENPGAYVVNVIVSDTYSNTDRKEYEFEVEQAAPIDYSSLIITEVFPSPASEDEEWIELYNGGSNSIDLSGIILDDVLDSGSSPYILPLGSEIPGNGYFVVSESESGIAFNNSGDWVVLLQPDGETIVDQVEYPSVSKSESYALFEGDWYMTSEPTPGEGNVIPEEDFEEGEVISISEAKGKLDQRVLVDGFVSAATGETGNGVAYIQDSTGGIRVKTDVKLSRGEGVQIKGEIREAWGEIYINTEEVAKIEQKKAPAAQELKLSEVKASFLGELISVKGEVARVEGGSFWLSNGKAEVKVYLSSSIGWERPEWISKGSNGEVTGILSQWGFDDEGAANLRVLPRDEDDLVNLGEILGDTDASSLADKLPKTFAGWPVLPGFATLITALGAKIRLKRRKGVY